MRRISLLAASAITLLALTCLVLAGCSADKVTQPDDNLAITAKKKPVEPTLGTGEFALETKYSYIMTSPGGGGVFIVRLLPGNGFSGDVSLTLSADPTLNAQMTSAIVNAQTTIVEVEVYPANDVASGLKDIVLTATNQDGSQVVILQAEVRNILSDPYSLSTAKSKKKDFESWLATAHPEVGSLRGTWFAYMTYPGLKIVEHWTFLGDNYEWRVCYHVMIPPDDWSKMLLRPRGAWDGILAAQCDTDGATPYDIPVSEYPTISGY